MWFQPLPGSFLEHFYDSVGIDPRQFQYQQNAGVIATGVTPYAGDGSNFGFFFKADGVHSDGMWLVDPWAKKLAGAPIPADAKRELLAMQDTPDHHPQPHRHGDAVARRLDAITLEDDLMVRHGLSRETIRRYLSPVSGGGSGIGADVLSAYTDYAPDLLFPWEKQKGPQMFPGGNTGVARHIVKALVPGAIPGPATMAAICQARVDFAALDQPHQPTRIRLRSTVISLEHEGGAARSQHVNIVYLRDGRLHRVRARSVVLANGNWTINSIVRDLPAEYRHAYAQFFRAPCIMANVAVRNWRFLAKLGISQCQWFDGIGNYMAVRRVATFGGGVPALSPDSPTVLTLKILFAHPGKPLPEQVNTGRYQMMTTPFSLYEKQIREQFAGMFGRQGFDGRRDIAGIILNRWGHAYLAPQPGFFFGKDGKRPPAELMRRHPFGRIAFANSDLSGIMDHRASIMEAHRAVEQVVALAT
jgi:spermidine dehydrogenase